ncbi:hypothetical protein KI387_011790 [Taxus chinensis]|uniref:Uncharacterized protein n=1 Tax=Taxus chinensis TaxID=29808 RepID=A0AA38FFV2_TAXCH|nr:hypothetical protein KI387_011790 [Taxus chinensis]
MNTTNVSGHVNGLSDIVQNDLEMSSLHKVSVRPPESMMHSIKDSVKETFFPDDPFKQFKNQPRKRKPLLGVQRLTMKKIEEEKAFVDQTKENSDFEEEFDTELNIDDSSDQNDEDYEVEEDDEDEDWVPSPSHKASNECKHQRSASTDVDGENPIQKKNVNNNAMENKSVEEENTVEAYTSSARVHEPPMQMTPISIRTKESEGNDMNDKEKISTEDHKGKNMADPLIEVTDFSKFVEVEPGKPKNEARDMAAYEFTIGEKKFMFLEPDHAKKVGIAKIHATKPGTKCHGRSLERDCIVICVEESYVDDAPLHFPHIGADTVGESKKTYCIWFKDCLKAINQKEDGKETKRMNEYSDDNVAIEQRNSEGDTEMQLSEKIHSSQQQGKRLKGIKSAASVHTHLTPDEMKGNKRKIRGWMEARNSIAVNKQRRNLKSSQI